MSKVATQAQRLRQLEQQYREQIQDLQYNLLYGETEKDRRYDDLQRKYTGLQFAFNEVGVVCTSREVLLTLFTQLGLKYNSLLDTLQRMMSSFMLSGTVDLASVPDLTSFSPAQTAELTLEQTMCQ